jgi:hypothetical protein
MNSKYVIQSIVVFCLNFNQGHNTLIATLILKYFIIDISVYCQQNLIRDYYKQKKDTTKIKEIIVFCSVGMAKFHYFEMVLYVDPNIKVSVSSNNKFEHKYL